MHNTLVEVALMSYILNVSWNLYVVSCLYYLTNFPKALDTSSLYDSITRAKPEFPSVHIYLVCTFWRLSKVKSIWLKALSRFWQLWDILSIINHEKLTILWCFWNVSFGCNIHIAAWLRITQICQFYIEGYFIQ